MSRSRWLMVVLLLVGCGNDPREVRDASPNAAERDAARTSGEASAGPLRDAANASGRDANVSDANVSDATTTDADSFGSRAADASAADGGRDEYAIDRRGAGNCSSWVNSEYPGYGAVQSCEITGGGCMEFRGHVSQCCVEADAITCHGWTKADGSPSTFDPGPCGPHFEFDFVEDGHCGGTTAVYRNK